MFIIYRIFVMISTIKIIFFMVGTIYVEGKIINFGLFWLKKIKIISIGYKEQPSKNPNKKIPNSTCTLKVNK